MIYFTSDLHMGHKNIIKFQAHTRPYNNLHEMHSDYIKKWNDTIEPNNTIYHLGDFSFNNPERYICHLNGHIKFVPGNHDKWARKEKYQSLRSKSGSLIEILPPIITITHKKQKIILCHYPIREWDSKHHGSWHLCGHSHGNLHATKLECKDAGLCLDVGVDSWNGCPLSFYDIQKLMEKKEQVKDHRNK